MVRKFLLLFFSLVLFCSAAGCSSHVKGNVGQLSVYQVPSKEAQWIRDGEPMEFEGDLWYPQDAVDVLLDSEVLLIGECQGVQVFVDKVDVRPFRVLYSKFGENKFRIFKRHVQND